MTKTSPTTIAGGPATGSGAEFVRQFPALARALAALAVSAAQPRDDRAPETQKEILK